MCIYIYIYVYRERDIHTCLSLSLNGATAGCCAGARVTATPLLDGGEGEHLEQTMSIIRKEPKGGL